MTAIDIGNARKGILEKERQDWVKLQVARYIKEGFRYIEIRDKFQPADPVRQTYADQAAGKFLTALDLNLYSQEAWQGLLSCYEGVEGFEDEISKCKLYLKYLESGDKQGGVKFNDLIAPNPENPEKLLHSINEKGPKLKLVKK